MDTLTSFYNSVRTKVNPTLSADEVIEKYGFEREEPALAKKKKKSKKKKSSTPPTPTTQSAPPTNSETENVDKLPHCTSKSTPSPSTSVAKVVLHELDELADGVVGEVEKEKEEKEKEKEKEKEEEEEEKQKEKEKEKEKQKEKQKQKQKQKVEEEEKPKQPQPKQKRPKKKDPPQQQHTKTTTPNPPHTTPTQPTVTVNPISTRLHLAATSSQDLTSALYALRTFALSPECLRRGRRKKLAFFEPAGEEGGGEPHGFGHRKIHVLLSRLKT